MGRVTPEVPQLRAMKARGEKIAMLTAYDYPTARLLDEAGVDVLLVGDSVGMVVLGYPDTTLVTMEEMEHHTRAVARGARRALILADMPYRSCDTPEDAVANAQRLIHAGAQAVKLEGGVRVASQIKAITDAGIPVMAHIGFTPQSEHNLGGFRVQGRGAGAEKLREDAHAVQDAGAFAVVLEMVPADIAGQVTKELTIPTIGIGAGVDCDAQVLVWPDMAGFTGGRVPKFVKKYADLRAELLRAAKEYADDVRGGTFPGPEHSFD